jgi:formylglycine-generating enzyme required for sulfatase activity
MGRGIKLVINVNSDDARQYAAWLSRMTGKAYRLLTEAEFEYAARAGTQTARFWGNEIGQGNANCDGCGSKWDNRETSPAGSFKPNAFGLYDMLGNVFEWTEDCFHGDYNGAPQDGSAWLADGIALAVSSAAGPGTSFHKSSARPSAAVLPLQQVRLLRLPGRSDAYRRSWHDHGQAGRAISVQDRSPPDGVHGAKLARFAEASGAGTLLRRTYAARCPQLAHLGQIEPGNERQLSA